MVYLMVMETLPNGRGDDYYYVSIYGEDDELIKEFDSYDEDEVRDKMDEWEEWMNKEGMEYVIS